MDRSTTRAWRRIQKKRVWRNRLQLIFRAFTPVYVEDSSMGRMHEARAWTELRNVKWCQAYRTTGQPCSCQMCSGERYKRVNFKRETEKAVVEQLEI